MLLRLLLALFIVTGCHKKQAATPASEEVNVITLPASPTNIKLPVYKDIDVIKENTVGVFYAGQDGFNLYEDQHFVQPLCKVPIGTQFLIKEDTVDYLLVRLDKIATDVGCPDDANYLYVKRTDVVFPAADQLARIPQYSRKVLEGDVMVYRKEPNSGETPECILPHGSQVLMMSDKPIRMQIPKTPACPFDMSVGYLIGP